MTAPEPNSGPRPRPVAAAAFAVAALIVAAPVLLLTRATPRPDAPPVSVPRPPAPRPPAPVESTKPATQQESTAEAPERKPARPMREVRVRIACDEEFRRRPNWKSEAALRLTFASEVYEREFAIAWRIVDFVEWSSDDDAEKLGGLLDELESRIPTAGADLVLGFTGQSRKKGASTTYELYGQAHFYGRAAVSRAEGAVDESGGDTRILCHELGHVLGAWHSGDARSIMSSGTPASPILFDPVTREAIEVGREIVVGASVSSLGPERESRLVAVYRRGHAKSDCWFTPAEAWETVARRRGKTDVHAEVAPAWERAATLHEASEGLGAKSTMRCRLMASKWRAYVKDLDAALSLAQTAQDDAEKYPASEAVVGEAAEQLADVLDRRGDAAGALKLRERVLASRKTKLGADAEATKRIATAIAAHAPSSAKASKAPASVDRAGAAPPVQSEK